jgi:hypothetical protein
VLEFVAGGCWSGVFVLWWGKCSTGACIRVVLANKSLVGELLPLRFLRMVLLARAKIQVVCSAGPQSPQFSRWVAKFHSNLGKKVLILIVDIYTLSE